MRKPVPQCLEETANFIDARMCLHNLRGWLTASGVRVIQPTQRSRNAVRDFGQLCELSLQNRLEEPRLS
jgi:hypothetical protein